MEENNDLKDIVFEKEDENKVGKLKKILIYLAISILLFLAVLIIMRALNKPQITQNDSRLVLPPIAQKEEIISQKDDQSFKQVPIIEEEAKLQSFEAMVNNLKEREVQKDDILEPEKETVILIEEDSPKQKEETKIVKNDIKKQENIKKPEKVSVKQSRALSPASKGIYVQVAASSTVDPKSALLKKLRNLELDYSIYKTNINGKEISKILVGPYDKNSINSELSKIRKDVDSRAFIFRVP